MKQIDFFFQKFMTTEKTLEKFMKVIAYWKMVFQKQILKTYDFSARKNFKTFCF